MRLAVEPPGEPEPSGDGKQRQRGQGRGARIVGIRTVDMVGAEQVLQDLQGTAGCADPGDAEAPEATDTDDAAAGSTGGVHHAQASGGSSAGDLPATDTDEPISERSDDPRTAALAALALLAVAGGFGLSRRFDRQAHR